MTTFKDGIFGINYLRSKSKYIICTSLIYEHNISANQKLPDLKTVEGVIHTKGV